jgi:hypothetical protein
MRHPRYREKVGKNGLARSEGRRVKMPTTREDISETLEAIAFDVKDGTINKDELKSSLESLSKEVEEMEE